MTSHSGQDPQEHSYSQVLSFFSVEAGCLNVLWVCPLALPQCPNTEIRLVIVYKNPWRMSLRYSSKRFVQTNPPPCAELAEVLAVREKQQMM